MVCCFMCTKTGFCDGKSGFNLPWYYFQHWLWHHWHGLWNCWGKLFCGVLSVCSVWFKGSAYLPLFLLPVCFFLLFPPFVWVNLVVECWSGLVCSVYTSVGQLTLLTCACVCVFLCLSRVFMIVHQLLLHFFFICVVILSSSSFNLCINLYLKSKLCEEIQWCLWCEPFLMRGNLSIMEQRSALLLPFSL